MMFSVAFVTTSPFTINWCASRFRRVFSFAFCSKPIYHSWVLMSFDDSLIDSESDYVLTSIICILSRTFLYYSTLISVHFCCFCPLPMWSRNFRPHIFLDYLWDHLISSSLTYHLSVPAPLELIPVCSKWSIYVLQLYQSSS